MTCDIASRWNLPAQQQQRHTPVASTVCSTCLHNLRRELTIVRLRSRQLYLQPAQLGGLLPIFISGRVGVQDEPPLRLPSISTRKRVVLVRHGQSTWNAEGRIQGSSDFSELTAKGMAQAETTRDMVGGSWVCSQRVVGSLVC